MSSKHALICGVSGQDGAYLARYLLAKGYRVTGTSRDAELSSFGNLVRLGIRDHVKTRSMTLTDFRSVLQTLNETEPGEIYNLAGQTSVGLSFAQPVETLESIAHATLNLLEAVRYIGRPLRVYNAASSECFGETTKDAANEESPFRPRSPYGVAKAAAFWEVANYREAYGLFACSGILANHESSLRPARFVTRKVIATACRIAGGSSEKLTIGETRVRRDWGYAPEYVDAMWRMLQNDRPEDFVIATGESNSLGDFIAAAFEAVGLNWKDHTVQDTTIFRTTDILESRVDPSRAKERLNWEPRTRMRELVQLLIAQEQGRAPL